MYSKKEKELLAMIEDGDLEVLKKEADKFYGQSPRVAWDMGIGPNMRRHVIVTLQKAKYYPTKTKVNVQSSQ
jgi:hypothetical protein